MDALSGFASVTQLAVYTHSAWKAFTRLYIELKGGPSLWQEHITNLNHIRKVVERISTVSQEKRLDAAAQITELLREVTGIAEKALDIIEGARKKVFGVRWSAIGATELLTGVFESLKAKRDILLLVLSHENLNELSTLSTVASRMKSHAKSYDMSIHTIREKKVESDAKTNGAIELSAVQSGHGSTMISNNGLAQILSHVDGPIKIEAKSTGDRAAMNSNNTTMDADVVKQQLDIAEIYAHVQEQVTVMESRGKQHQIAAHADSQRYTLESTHIDRRKHNYNMDNDSACDMTSGG